MEMICSVASNGGTSVESKALYKKLLLDCIQREKGRSLHYTLVSAY